METNWTDELLAEAVKCPHDRGEAPADQPVCIHAPLTLAGIGGLLSFAAAAPQDVQRVSRVQIRLGMAIPGMQCPHEIIGEVAERQNALDAYFIAHYAEGGTDANIRRIADICRVVA